MNERLRQKLPKYLLCLTLFLCVLVALAGIYMLFGHRENNIASFAEAVTELPDGWTMTDSDGTAQEVSLPLTIAYGKDGHYTLSRTLSDENQPLQSPVLAFYSNYVDISIALDGETLYTYPRHEVAFAGATGNTYHYVRLPSDYSGKVLSVVLQGQLGDQITYLLRAPQLGSKATMLYRVTHESMPSIILAACIFIFSLALIGMYLAFLKRLRLEKAFLYTAIFGALFAVYIFCETTYCQVIISNGAFLCFLTLILLAALPIPLIGAFADNINQKYFFIPMGFMVLNILNLLGQLVFHLGGIFSVRAMLPVTHFCILVSIVVIVPFMFFNKSKEKPKARRNLLAAAPMLIGGTIDIILIWTESPSFNNSFWFIVGVSAYIVIQFASFVRNFFSIYRNALQGELYKNMAYRDLLTGLDNRNAYEQRRKALSKTENNQGLCCIVLDINNLKRINDTQGHGAGDDAIIAVSRILTKRMPSNGSCYRTGGDEFIVLLHTSTLEETKALAQQLVQDAITLPMPLSLSYGVGEYDAADESVDSFISRVDTRMYEYKRLYKERQNTAVGKPEK